MRTFILFAVGILGLALSQGQVQAQTAKKGALNLNAKVQFTDTWTKTNADLYKLTKPRLPPRDQATIPKQYLSIDQVDRTFADYNTFLVTGYVHNPGKKTVTGVKYDIEYWNGLSWKKCRWDFPWYVVNGNTFKDVPPGYTKVGMRINYPIDATKYRFLVNPSVEGSKFFRNPKG